MRQNAALCDYGLRLPKATMFAIVDSVDQEQTARFVQSVLNLHCPIQ